MPLGSTKRINLAPVLGPILCFPICECDQFRLPKYHDNVVYSMVNRCLMWRMMDPCNLHTYVVILALQRGHVYMKKALG